MSEQIRPVRIGDELVTTEESIEVRSPYDGGLLGRVPKCDESHVDRAVQAATAAMAEGLPLWKRVEVLDQAEETISGRQIVDVPRLQQLQAANVPQRVERVRRSQFGVMVAVHQLESLGDEFHVANPARH